MKPPRIQLSRTACQVAWGLMALWLAACSSKNTPLPPPIYTCSSDTDCKSIGFVCDKQRLECVCTSDSMCKDSAAPYCNVFTGRCVATHLGCTDTSCPTGQFCDESIRSCAPLHAYCDSCTSDAECGPGNKCVVHPDFPGTPSFCAKACSADGKCDTGQECAMVASGVKQCVPQGQLCGGGQSCTPDSLTPCQTDGQCSSSPGQKCDTMLQRCVAAVNTCAAGQACDPRSFSCVQACQTDSDCTGRFGSGFVCFQRTCRAQGECTNDAQCPTNQFCLIPPGDTTGLGSCQPTCQMDSDCPIDQQCLANPQTGRKSCAAGCSNNNQCLLNEICNASGVCEAGHCQNKSVCDFDYACVNNSCVKQNGQCASCNNGCAAGAICGQLYICCTAAQCPNMAGVTCVSGQSALNAGCNSGENLCGFKRCLMPCMTEDDCPHGFSCTSLEGANYCEPLNDEQLCLTPP